MKTIQFFALFAILALATVSCQKETITPEGPVNNETNEDLASLMIGTYEGHFSMDSKGILIGEGHPFVVTKVDNNTAKFSSEHLGEIEVEIMKHISIVGRLDSPYNAMENPPYLWYFEAQEDDFLLFSSGDNDIFFSGHRVQ